ncbi:MAG: hypothetical protein JWR08_1716 [Enterovirga sp.]|jgi:hypothetical protein|nr:hypothetical protein [Enterovirga sp.]
MIELRSSMLAAALVAASMIGAGAASAAPAAAGAAQVGALSAPVELAQWGYGDGYEREYRRPRYGYDERRRFRGGPGYGFYGHPRRAWGGPATVCRIRQSPWGPRRVCWERW